MMLLRKIAAVGLLLFGAQFLWTAFTVPMIAATAPLLLAAGFIGGGLLLWHYQPKRQA